MFGSILSSNSGFYLFMHIRKSQLLHQNIRFWKYSFEKYLLDTIYGVGTLLGPELWTKQTKTHGVTPEYMRNQLACLFLISYSVRQHSMKSLPHIPSHLSSSERKGQGHWFRPQWLYFWTSELKCHLSQHLSGVADTDSTCPESQFQVCNLNFPRTYFKNKCLHHTANITSPITHKNRSKAYFVAI